jgi:hypothetical protein
MVLVWTKLAQRQQMPFSPAVFVRANDRKR